MASGTKARLASFFAPPKLTTPVRMVSLPVALIICPGTARHIVRSILPWVGRHDLAKRYAAVVGRHPLVPVGTMTRGAQARNHPFGQGAVLETAAAQHDAFLADSRRHIHRHGDQHVV